MKNKSGFTLVELLMSVAIFSLACLVVFFVYQMGINSWDTIAVQARLAGEARMGIEKMSKELRTSKSSNIDTSSSTQLRLKVPTVDTSTGTISSWSNWIRYDRGGLNSNQLLRTDEGTSAVTVLANRITNLQFTANSNPSTITILVTAQDSTAKGVTVPVTLSSSVDLRN